MKKIIFMSILMGLFTTGCINNSAIQQLNESAERYLAQSEPSKAVCRLEASKELDPNIYETRYNLGVAYVELKDYMGAISELNDAIKIKEDGANAYYTLGVAYEGMGYDILNKYKEDDTISEDNNDTEDEKLTPEEKENALSALSNAVDAYKTYLEKNPTADDKADVEKQIESIKNTLEEQKEGD